MLNVSKCLTKCIISDSCEKSERTVFICVSSKLTAVRCSVCLAHSPQLPFLLQKFSFFFYLLWPCSISGPSLPPSVPCGANAPRSTCLPTIVQTKRVLHKCPPDWSFVSSRYWMIFLVHCVMTESQGPWFMCVSPHLLGGWAWSSSLWPHCHCQIYCIRFTYAVCSQ